MTTQYYNILAFLTQQFLFTVKLGLHSSNLHNIVNVRLLNLIHLFTYIL